MFPSSIPSSPRQTKYNSKYDNKYDNNNNNGTKNNNDYKCSTAQSPIHLHLSARQCSQFARAILFAARTTGSGNINNNSSSSGNGSELILFFSRRDGVRLHGVNRAKTSCIDINFKPNFFDHFHCDIHNTSNNDYDNNNNNSGGIHFGVYAKVMHIYSQLLFLPLSANY